jgi:3-oxoacyl-[acyl-carrier protein] reductase
MSELTGQVAVVTGASGAIGVATACALARAGADVAVLARRRPPLDALVAQIEAAGRRGLAIAGDCTDADELRRAFDEIQTTLGPPELLAAFAGGNGRPKPTGEVEPEEWRDVIDGDLTSTFLTIRAALPAMLTHRRGAIVTMSSSAGRLPGKASVAYAAAKAGVAMLTRHIAVELGPNGIRANCLAPSAILNESMKARMDIEQRGRLAESFPLGRLGVPGDVAAAALFLLSDDASWITGVTLDVAGGRTVL